MITLREAKIADVSAVMQLIDEAKEFLRQSGSDQWQSGYPAEKDILNDISLHQGFVLTVDEKIAGYAAVITGEELAYTAIQGAWSNDSRDYVTVHRIALADSYRGQGLSAALFAEIFRQLRAQGYTDFRVDTHAKNKIMQHIFEREGFRRRGTVWIEGERIAYQREF